jgi:AAA domain
MFYENEAMGMTADGEWHPAEVRNIFANFAARQDRPKATVDAFAALYAMGAEDESIDDLYERAIARGLPQDVVDMCLRKGQQIACDRQMTRKNDLKVINGELSRHNAIYQNAKGGLSEQPVEPPPELEEWDAGNDPGPILPRQWLMGNQFCRKFLSSLIASGGTGKSALRLLQFISLALGRSLTGQHVFRRCRVLLVSLEDDRDELERRIAAVLKYYNIDRAELKGWLFCATPKLVKLAEVKNKVRSLGALQTMVMVGVQIDNGTEEYPNGDEVQTVIPWTPPETWSNLSSVSLNAALTEIDITSGAKLTEKGRFEFAEASRTDERFPVAFS